MKKINSEILGRALKAISNSHLFKSGQILEKEYDGYISSFGASVINSGLLPALSFYTDVHKSKSKPRRYKVLKVIFQVVSPEEANDKDDGLLNYTLSKVIGGFSETASSNELGEVNKKELRKIRAKILEASVAVKLAMRNFEHADSNT